MKKSFAKIFITLSIMLSLSLVSSTSSVNATTNIQAGANTVDFINAQSSTYYNNFIDETLSTDTIGNSIIEKHKLTLPSKNLYVYYWYSKPVNIEPTNLVYDIHGWGTTDLLNVPQMYAERGYAYFGLEWWTLYNNSDYSMYPENMEKDLLINASIFASHIKETAIKVREPNLYNNGFCVIGNSFGGLIGATIAQSDEKVNKMFMYSSTGYMSDSFGKTRLFDVNITDANSIIRMDISNVLTRNIPIYTYIASNDVYFPFDASMKYYGKRENTWFYIVPNRSHDFSGISNEFVDIFIKNDLSTSKPAKTTPILQYTLNASNKNSYDRLYTTVTWEGVNVEKVYFSNSLPLRFSYWANADYKNGEYSIFKYFNMPLNVIVEGIDKTTGLKVSYLLENIQ